MTTLNQAGITSQDYRQARIAHWDEIARQPDRVIGWGRYYHQRLTEIFRFLVLPGQRVIEIGCGQGDLLAALKPARGLGVDFSGEMIKRAKRTHPELFFIQADTHDLRLKEQFDVIILSDLVNDLWDVQAVLEQMEQLAHPRTRLIINT